MERSSERQPDLAGRAPRPSMLTEAATRREVFLFGLLILALVWMLVGQRVRTVIVVPDSAVHAGVIT